MIEQCKPAWQNIKSVRNFENFDSKWQDIQFVP